MTGAVSDQVPAIAHKPGGQGVQVQRKVLPQVSDRMPFPQQQGGRGVQQQRKELANGTGRISAPFP